MRPPSKLILPLVALFLPLAAAAQTPPPARSASADVPAAIAARARTIAEGSQSFRASLSDRALRGRGLVDSRLVFVGVDLIEIKDEDGDEAAPLYRVRHYRYADDTTITSLVDVRSGRVREQTEARHVAVPLSEAEFAEARDLALRDSRVVEVLGRWRDRVVVEPLVVRTQDTGDPWFARRIVRLLFRVDDDYLTRPVVYVDLTGRQVMIHQPHRPAAGERP